MLKVNNNNVQKETTMTQLFQTSIKTRLQLFTAAFIISAVGFVIPANANDLLVLDGNGNTTMSGEITDMGYDSFKMESNGETIDVDLDDANLDDDVQDLLKEGMSVTVEGDYDDGELEADRVITTGRNVVDPDIDINIDADNGL